LAAVVGVAALAILLFVAVDAWQEGRTESALATGAGILALVAVLLVALAQLVSTRRVMRDMRLVRDRSARIANSTRRTNRWTRNMHREVVRGPISHLPGQIAAINQQILKAAKGTREHVSATAAEGQEALLAHNEVLSQALLEQVLTAMDQLERLQTNTIQTSLLRVDGLSTALATEFAQLEAFLGIQALLDPALDPPSFRGWAVSPDLAAYLAATVANLQPEHIVEIGSGISTLVFASTLERLGKGHVHALEHEQSFGTATREALEQFGLSEWATVVDAPLVKTPIGVGEWHWYDIAPLSLPERIDLLFVDGPPAEVGPTARYPALPVFLDRLVPGSVVIVDDTDRPDDHATVERWSKEYTDFTLRYLPHERGTAELSRLRVDAEP
jgi:predicted O-methyltransferase YrrM